MSQKFKYYKSLILEGNNIEEVVNVARKDYFISVNLSSLEEEELYVGDDIPFNLERTYFDELVSEGEFSKAEKILKRMRSSYESINKQNFIEGYEYHLKSIQQANSIIKKGLEVAKRDFNQHTITLIGVVVGVVAIFGTANETLRIKNFDDAILTFIVISFTIIFLIFVIFEANKKLH